MRPPTLKSWPPLLCSICDHKLSGPLNTLRLLFGTSQATLKTCLFTDTIISTFFFFPKTEHSFFSNHMEHIISGHTFVFIFNNQATNLDTSTILKYSQHSKISLFLTRKVKYFTYFLVQVSALES